MKHNKYNASKKQCLQGHMHDSKKEAFRCNELHQMLERGEIKALKVQPAYTLVDAYDYGWRKERALTYTADFEYIQDGVKVVEDVKSDATKTDKLYIAKRKIFEWKHCRDLRMVFRENVM